MNICKRCGRELEEDAAYCPKCGTRWMAQASQPVRRTARTRGDKIASLVVIGTLCIIAVVGGLYVASLPTAPINSESDSHSESAANPAAERGAPVPIAPVAITLSKTQDSALNALIRSALKNAQKDFFGEIVIKNNDFGVRTSGTALFLDMLGDSYALNCGGAVNNTDGTSVPNAMIATVQFGAFAIANLAPGVFQQLPAVTALRLNFFTMTPDKFGQPQRHEFFRSEITREQSAKMDWTWFKNAVYTGTFDPTAFQEFDLYFGRTPTKQDVAEIVATIMQQAQSAEENYGLPDSNGLALIISTQMANKMNCALLN